jgi:hypothetical protein
LARESAAVDTNATDLWFKRLLELLEGYKAWDIYNADDTGLFFNCLPDQTLAMKGKTCHGGKVQRGNSRCYCAQTAMSQTNEYPSLLESPQNHGVSKM